MKVKNFLAMAAIALCAVACSDDDDVVNFSENVEGTYDGSLSMFGKDPADATIKMEAQSNGKVTIVLPKAGSGKMVLPSVTVKDIAITETSTDEYAVTMAATDSVVVEANGMSITTKALSGTVKNNKLTLKYSVKPGKMPMYIPFDFEGAKK